MAKTFLIIITAVLAAVLGCVNIFPENGVSSGELQQYAPPNAEDLKIFRISDGTFAGIGQSEESSQDISGITLHITLGYISGLSSLGEDWALARGIKYRSTADEIMNVYPAQIIDNAVLTIFSSQDDVFEWHNAAIQLDDYSVNGIAAHLQNIPAQRAYAIIITLDEYGKAQSVEIISGSYQQ